MIDPTPAPRHRRTVLRFSRSQAGAEKRTAGRHAARLPVEPPLVQAEPPVVPPVVQVEPPLAKTEPPVLQVEPQVEPQAEPPFMQAQAPLQQPEIYCWS